MLGDVSMLKLKSIEKYVKNKSAKKTVVSHWIAPHTTSKVEQFLSHLSDSITRMN